LTEGDKLFLINVMETYLPTEALADAGEKIMQALADVEMTWLEKAHVEGKQEILLRLLTIKFGTLPETFVKRIEAITANDALDALAEQVLAANSLAEIHLPDG
jgi:hypothetical protein